MASAADGTARDLPDLGLGVIWFAGLDPLIEAGNHLIDFLEIEPATLSLSPEGSDASDPLKAHAADARPTVVHGVSTPLGGTIAPDGSELSALARAATTLDSPWVSEHLSIDRLLGADGQVVSTGFFLPPLQTPAAVDIAAERIVALRNTTGRPVAFETGVNYLRPQPGELSDGDFWAAVAEAADCFILCDLHNLWCNEVNGRQPLDEAIDSLPLDRVCEVHLAGGQRHGDFLLDAHSDLVDPALMMRAGEIVERLPNLRAITFELMPDYVPRAGIDAAAYRRQLEQLQRLWDRRGTATRATATWAGSTGRALGGSALRGAETGTPQSWEQSLGAALHRSPSPLDDDPGMAVYLELIDTIRAGAIVTALPLSYRLLALTLGLDQANLIIDRYRTSCPAAAWARDEARAFASFLESEVSGVPYLDDVVRFELTAHEVMIEGRPAKIAFGCEPTQLLNALRRGRRPPLLEPASHQLTVTPP